MSEIVNKYLLAGDKFMPEMHFKQPKFTYSVYWPFTKSKERIQNFKENGNISTEMSWIKYLAFNMIWFNNLEIRTVSDKLLNDKAFNIAKNPKYKGYQRGHA